MITIIITEESYISGYIKFSEEKISAKLMQKGMLIILVLLFTINTITAQSTKEKWEKQYQEQITKTHLYGVYIPEDLADTFSEFNKLIDDNSKKKFKAAYEEAAVRKLHFSFGRWIIYNWQFYEGSRLSHYMRKLGIYHPDDMASVIIRSYHRYLNKKDLGLKQQIQEIEMLKEEERALKQHRLDSLAKLQGETLTPKGKN